MRTRQSPASAPALALGAAAAIAFGVVWHTLVQDFDLDPVVGGLLAAAQTAPLVAAARWPVGAWVVSALVMVTTATVVPAGPGGVWPDPNLYVHLGVTFVAGVRAGLRGAAVMWSVLVAASVLVVAIDPTRAGSPGLAETVGLASVVVVAAVAVRAREDAVRQLGVQAQVAEVEGIRAATLQERSRIARELHDVVAHHMSLIAVQAEAAPLRVDDAPAPLRDALGAIRHNAVAGLTELRHVVGVLRDTDDPSGPQPGVRDLEGLVANVRAAGLPVESTTQGVPRALPAGLELSAFRIVQEALNNVMRHTPGAVTRVSMVYGPDALRLAIVNDAHDGVGCRVATPHAGQPGTGVEAMRPPDARPPTPGHGLLGMRERVAMFGGRLDAGPTTGGGYTVTAVLPTDGAEHA